MRSLSAAGFLSVFLSLVQADCPGFPCDVIAVKFAEDQQTCGVDPSGNTDIEFFYAVCPCQNQVLAHRATVTETDGSVVTLSGSTFLPSSTDLAFITASYTEPWARLQESSLVGVEVDVNGYRITAGFTYSPIRSITYTDATTTATVYEGSTVTTTSTMEVTSTEIQPQQTSFTPCTTGTMTTSAAASTSTVTSTITPSPVTKSKFPKIVVTTVHKSCFSLPKGIGHKRAEAREAIVQARAIDGPYEEPTCYPRDAPPPQTTITTSTVVTSSTSTTTVTNTAFATTTTTSTSLPTPATTTVCNNVAATVTVTPTVTSTAVTTAKGVTVTKRRTITLTYTKYPGLFPTPCHKTTKRTTLPTGCPKATGRPKST